MRTVLKNLCQIGGKHKSSAANADAKGDYEIAEAMIQNAIAQGIPITSDPALVGVLMNLELNEEIPEELYVAVAVILSWVYWLRGDAPESLS